MSRPLSLIFIVTILFSAFESVEKSHSLSIIQKDEIFGSIYFSVKTTLPFNQNYLMLKETAVYKKWDNNHLFFKFVLNGDYLYKETFNEIGFITSFSSFNIGGSISFFNVSIKNYGKLKQFTINTQSSYKISEKFRIKLCLRNITGLTSKILIDDLPQIIKLGLFYNITPRHSLKYLIEKDTMFPVKQIGFYSMSVFNNIDVLSGYCGSPSEIYFGIKTKFKNLEFSTINAIHPALGLTYSVSISYAK